MAQVVPAITSTFQEAGWKRRKGQHTSFKKIFWKCHTLLVDSHCLEHRWVATPSSKAGWEVLSFTPVDNTAPSKTRILLWRKEPLDDGLDNEHLRCSSQRLRWQEEVQPKYNDLKCQCDWAFPFGNWAPSAVNHYQCCAVRSSFIKHFIKKVFMKTWEEGDAMSQG